MTNNDNAATSGVLVEIHWVRRRQDKRFGTPHHDAVRWVAILAEELGEAAKAAIDRPARYRAELVYLAAVAVAAIESVDRQTGGSDES